MRLSKGYKWFVVIILFIVAVIICFIIWRNDMKNRVMEIADDKGYEIQLENNNFIITHDGIVYYYKCILEKLYLVKIYTELAPVTELKVKDDIGKITITVVGKDEFDVALEDSVIEVNNQGREMAVKENIRFVCSSEFTLESINQNDIVSQMGKAEKYYNKITNNYISCERLREIYERGEAIAKELDIE